MPLLLLVLLLALAAPATAAAQRPDELPQLGGAVGEEACPAPSARPAPPAPRAVAAAGPTVRATIRRAAAGGFITPEQALSFRGAYASAIAARNRLGGSRRAELAAVVAQLEAFARTRLLTVSRMPVLFRQLRVNTAWWSANSIPRAPVAPKSTRPCAGGAGLGGARVVRGGVVYQWYSGQGLQIQQLGTAGRANAIVKACIEANPRLACDQAKVRRVMDALLGLAVERGGFRAWEYYFAFGGGRPPWISGLAQGTMMQALSRATTVLGDPKYLAMARAGRGAFQRRWPVGVRAPTSGGGAHYLIYSFSPGLRVLNGFLQSLVGLYDYAEAADDDTARRLFRQGDRQARREIPGADTGAWSRYSAGGAEADLGYHRLVRDFLRSLCERTKASTYCATANRFTRYLHEFAKVELLPRRRFWLSKISCVTVRVTRGGATVFRTTRVLRRGAHALGWSPPRKGTYRVEVEALDLMNHSTKIATTIRAR